jgi:class 3 adenylate cyclase/tetratricopeptide (TPR) repeat protein
VDAVPAPTQTIPAGERRQLTVMFTDLADSTALSGRLDPEDFRDTVRNYHAACAEAIERFGGSVGKWLGDGALAYFGYPESHEDDTQRAIRAGLQIVAWARQQKADQPVAVRVGLHTGLTVIAEMGSGERIEQTDLVGEAPNIAARLQSLAQPNAVVISGATERLARGFFLTESLGEQELKGVARPVEVFEVRGESTVAHRLDTAESLTPLVGREQEMTLLLDRWQNSADGDGQVVVLSGEPGIGKSRLLRTLRERLSDDHLRITLQCSQFHQNSALYPLIEHFQRLVQSADGGNPTDRLAAMLDDVGVDPAAVPLLAALLGLPLPEGTAPLDLTPEQQKQMTYQAMVAWIEAEALRTPVLLACEDLHWIDPSTLELVGMLVEREDPGSIMLLLTCRPEFTPPWPLQSNLTMLQLTRLGREEAREVMTRVAGGRQLAPEVAAQIVARTDGVPLFVEELTKMVLESGLLREEGDRYVLDGPLPPLAIPETLQDSLMARLDRLAPVKEVAQLGATIAREFSEELIAAVSPLSPEALNSALDALVASGLVYRRGFGPTARYVFKHALIQDAAYQSLLKSTRAHYHQLIAEAMISRFPDISEAQPEVVAHHYTEAGLPQQAVVYWQRAGDQALARSANHEAIAQLEKCLEVTRSIDSEEARDRSELAAKMALGSAYLADEGYVSTNAEASFRRARELCHKLGANHSLVTVLLGMRGYNLIIGKLQVARELGAECLQIAEREANPSLLAQACYTAGSAEFWLGNYEASLTYMERGADLYKTGSGMATIVAQMDQLVGCLFYQALATWFLGYPDRALEISRRMLDHGRSLNHAHSLTVALTFSSLTHLLRREMAEARAEGEEGVRTAAEKGIRQWGPMCQAQAGAAIAGQGDPVLGLETIDEAIELWSQLGSRLLLPCFLTLRAEALLLADRKEEATQATDEALAITAETNEGFYEADLYRLRGRSLLGRDDVAAEREFLSALEVARKRKTKSLELRAARDLATLYQFQGRDEEARALLQPVYGWFTEGHETADLIEARELLSELGAAQV